MRWFAIYSHNFPRGWLHVIHNLNSSIVIDHLGFGFCTSYTMLLTDWFRTLDYSTTVEVLLLIINITGIIISILSDQVCITHHSWYWFCLYAQYRTFISAVEFFHFRIWRYMLIWGLISRAQLIKGRHALMAKTMLLKFISFVIKASQI